MPDQPFITAELDRRIAVAQRKRNEGALGVDAANAALRPWAAAEAYLGGGKLPGYARNGLHRGEDLCSLVDTIAAITLARDHMARQIERDRQIDKLSRYRGLREAVRDLEWLRDLRAAFHERRPRAPAPDHFAAARKMVTPPARPHYEQPSLLADMFGPDGNPLPVHRNAA